MITIEAGKKMKVETARFGRLEAEPATFINFNEGLYGFPGAKSFLLIDTGNESDFRWLQSVEKPDLAFLVTDPTMFYPEFRAQVNSENPLVAAMADDYQLFAIVTVDRPTRKVSVNLAAPLAVHLNRREGCQLILSNKQLGTRHDLIEDFGAAFAKDCRVKA